MTLVFIHFNAISFLMQMQASWCRLYHLMSFMLHTKASWSNNKSQYIQVFLYIWKILSCSLNTYKLKQPCKCQSHHNCCTEEETANGEAFPRFQPRLVNTTCLGVSGKSALLPMTFLHFRTVYMPQMTNCGGIKLTETYLQSCTISSALSLVIMARYNLNKHNGNKRKNQRQDNTYAKLSTGKASPFLYCPGQTLVLGNLAL